jgi:tetratricopeptide (TPR) repeat protein
MALDSYSPCPCGSGKKFKWCCEPIYADINRAFQQEESGQHEAALRTLHEVVARNPGNPEAHGQLATLLFARGENEQADAVLQKAFDLNANYPYGLFLRAQIRLAEGEIAGALLLARKAADAYDPDAHDALGRVWWTIHECEARLRRPVAARAALRVLLRLHPGEEELRQRFEAVYGPEGSLPACVRKDHDLRQPAAGPRPHLHARADADVRAAWDAALKGAAGPRLSELARVFGQLTQEDATDAAAWFNLGLARAWLGDNRAAVEALERYLDLEADESAATEAAALAEALRCGPGLEDECDYHEFAFGLQLQDFSALSGLLREWSETGRLLLPPRERDDVFFAMVLDRVTSVLTGTALTGGELNRLAGYVMVTGPVVRVWGPQEEGVRKLLGEFRDKLGLAQLTESAIRPSPPAFHDTVTEALVFPSAGAAADALTAERVLGHARRFYEEVWPTRPRRSLRMRTPEDAARDPQLRKRLLGVIQFLQDCAGKGMLAGYDFDGLRRRLGLLAAPAAAPGEPAGKAADFATMDADALGALDVGSLSDEDLEQAYHAAQRLGHAELEVRFAEALTERPPRPGRPDRYLWYAFLIQQALRGGRFDRALDLVNGGEQFDCEHNEGRRRNDFELRRAQVHARRGEADQADDVFRRLIERVPGELTYRTTAAEAMLGLKQGARALRFAEEGVAQARKQNNRDAEQHLLELAGAAKKQMG